jgi:hypothetical protein
LEVCITRTFLFVGLSNMPANSNAVTARYASQYDALHNLRANRPRLAHFSSLPSHLLAGFLRRDAI